MKRGRIELNGKHMLIFSHHKFTNKLPYPSVHLVMKDLRSVEYQESFHFFLYFDGHVLRL